MTNSTYTAAVTRGFSDVLRAARSSGLSYEARQFGDGYILIVQPSNCVQVEAVAEEALPVVYNGLPVSSCRQCRAGKLHTIALHEERQTVRTELIPIAVQMG